MLHFGADCPSFVRVRAKAVLISLLLFALLFSGVFTGVVSAQEQQPRTFRIPFHSVTGGLILLDGKINGRPALLLLDTGAGPNFATYEAAGLKPNEGVIEGHVEIAFGSRGEEVETDENYGLLAQCESCADCNRLKVMALWEKIF